MLKRMLVLMLLALALAACGVGGVDEPTTAPTTEAATEPTEAPADDPKPTEAAEPTKETGSSGTVSSDFPLLGDAEAYQKGADDQVDIFVDAFLKSAESSSGGVVTPDNVEFYLTGDSFDETVKFYEEEMVAAGWTLDQSQPSPFATSLFFVSADMRTYAAVSITDMSEAPGSTVEKVIIGIMSVEQPAGAIDPDAPATGDDTLAGFDFAVPAPPDSEPYELGGDPEVDAGLEQMDLEVSQEAANEEAIYNGLTFYKTTATPEDIVKFYDEEMTALGWEGDAPNEEEYGTMLLYKDSSMERLVMVSIVDLKALQNIETDDLFVFTTVILPAGDETSGSNPTSGSGSQPSTPSESGGSSGSIDITAIPAPPGGTEIKEGDDPQYDLLIQTMASGATGETIYYTTDATLDEIKEFYENELSAMGLEASPGGATTSQMNLTLLYWDQDYNTVMVMAFEGSQFQAEKNLVMLVNTQ